MFRISRSAQSLREITQTDQQTSEKTLLEMRLKRTHVGAPLEQLPGGVLERLPRHTELLQRQSLSTSSWLSRKHIHAR